MLISLTKKSGAESDPASPRQAAARAEQLAAGVNNATAALEAHDAETAQRARAAGQALANATTALARALDRRSQDESRPGGEDTKLQKEAEAALHRGIELLHRLHFEIIRVEIQDDVGPDALPIEEVERATTEIRALADRCGGGGGSGAGDEDAS